MYFQMLAYTKSNNKEFLYSIFFQFMKSWNEIMI